MAGFRNMSRCFLCENEYQMGPHMYEGKFISRYQFGVCMSCYNRNWDGWAPHHEGKILSHLRSKGLHVPKRNSKGWLPRD